MTDQSTDNTATNQTEGDVQHDVSSGTAPVSVTKGKLMARQAFQTTDGKNFFDESEAAAHQSSLDNRDVIEAYVVTANVGPAQAGMLRNSLPAFLAFKAEVDGGRDISATLAIVAQNEATAKAEAKAKLDAKKAEEKAKADAAKAAAGAAA